MNYNEIKNDYKEYIDSYSTLINLLTEVLQQGEVTEANKGTLDKAYADYGSDYINIKRSLSTSKDTLLEDRITALENGKLDSNKDAISDILTNGGRNNSIFVGEDGKMYIDGEYVPKLKLVELEVEKVKAEYIEVKELVADKASIKDLEAINAKIENLEAGDVTITGKLDAVEADIKTLRTEDLTAINANIENLTANKANIEDLTATNAKIETLEAGYVNVTGKLDAVEANIGDLEVGKADIDDLHATNGNIDNLTSQVANINTLINGNLTSDNIHSLVLTAQKVTVEDAFIKNAMIDTVNANKINTGELNTNLVRVQSNDGSLTLNGSLQQFRDKNDKVRIQMGKDAQDNFTFALLDETGTGTIINDKGITANAIGSGLIVNEMINDNAQISGGKLDINSVIKEANDNGTETLKASKIKFDDTNQTLDVSFNKLSTKVETISGLEGDVGNLVEQVTSNTTALKVAQGEISTLISDTTITKEDGKTVKLKDAYNSTVQTVSGNSTSIGEHTTQIDKNTGEITTVKSDIVKIKTDITGISSSISSVESNVKTTIKQVELLYYLSTSQTELVGGTWSTTAPKWTDGKYMWSKTKVYYIDPNKSPTESPATCISGAIGPQGDKGQQGPSGTDGANGNNGSDGQSVVSVTLEYNKSTNPTTPPVQNDVWWTATVPQWQKNTYLWVRSKVIYENPSKTEYTTAYKDAGWDSANTSNTINESTTSKLSEFNQTLNGFGTRVSDVETKADESSAKVTELTQDINGFKTTVSETYATKTGVEIDLNESTQDLYTQLVQAQEKGDIELTKSIQDKLDQIVAGLVDPEEIKDISSKMSSFQQWSEGFKMEFDSFKYIAESGLEGVKGELEATSKYIDFVDGAILLGQKGSQFKVKITNTRIDFMQGDIAVAYISNNKLYITEAEVKDNLTIGKFAFIPRSNGNLSFTLK